MTAFGKLGDTTFTQAYRPLSFIFKDLAFYTIEKSVKIKIGSKKS